MTIGQFYAALDAFLATLPASAWTPDRNQITDDQFFAGQLFAVNGYADAHRAIEQIVSEGEGAKDNPLDFQNELAHYYRFGELFYDKVLTKIAEDPRLSMGAGSRSASTGRPVYPAIPDPGSHDFSKDSAGGASGPGGLQPRLQRDGRRAPAGGERARPAARRRGPGDVRPAHGGEGRAPHPARRRHERRRPQLPLHAHQRGSLRMSVLETPRIYFAGQMAWDPIITNNYTADSTTRTGAEPVLASERPVADFRQHAIATCRRSRPTGTRTAPTAPSSSTPRSAASTSAAASTPTIRSSASPASFLGMLVDCEPYGTFSSQLFFDSMQLRHRRRLPDLRAAQPAG